MISSADFGRLLHDLLCAWRLRTDSGSWIAPGQVLACGYPRQAGLAALHERGIQLIVNLHCRPHEAQALERLGIRELHLPTPDFTAPAMASIKRGVSEIDEAIAAGRRVAVHCGGGRGRTGTLIACWFVARGEAPAPAIERVRRLRPGSVETPEQEAVVHAFASEAATPLD